MRILLLPALLLSACTVTDAPENTAAPAPASTAAPALGPGPAPEPPATTTQGQPVTPGPLKTFGDWAVGCDNTRLCQLASLGGETVDFPKVTMAVLRQPGPEGAVDLSFQTLDDGGNAPPVRAVAIAVDGRRIALPGLTGAPARQVAAAMANGRTLTILEAGDRERARLSLAGASAALRWIDDRQGRAGTVTALVAKGDKPATTVPDRTAAPVIRAVVATGTAARPSPAQLTAMRKTAGCETEGVVAGIAPDAHALGGGATLVLLPCSTGAYNLSSALFVLRGAEVESARTDAPSGFGATPAAERDVAVSVVNGAWKDGELTSYAKGRGLGDCGVAQTFVWDGTMLRLSEQSEMRECRGNTNYLTTWRAQVVRQ